MEDNLFKIRGLKFAISSDDEINDDDKEIIANSVIIKNIDDNIIDKASKSLQEFPYY